MLRLGRLDRITERRIVGRHIAPAEQRQTFTRDHLCIDVANDLPPVCVGRHEQITDRILAGLRQFESELGGFLGKELVRNLHEDAGAVSHARIRADSAAMLEVAEDAQTVFDDLMRFAAFDVRDESERRTNPCRAPDRRDPALRVCPDLRSNRVRQILRCDAPRSSRPASPAQPLLRRTHLIRETSCSRSMLTDLEKGSPVRLIAARGRSCRAPPMSAPATEEPPPVLAIH